MRVIYILFSCKKVHGSGLFIRNLFVFTHCSLQKQITWIFLRRVQVFIVNSLQIHNTDVHNLLIGIYTYL